jgi:tricorn protease interacting factor F2/3
VIPEYRLLLDVDFAGLRWTGTVAFDVAPDTAPFALDSAGLEVLAVTLDGAAVDFRRDAAAEKLLLPRIGAGVLEVRFRGAVNETALLGLYRSRQGAGHILVTQCEPIGARRVFPCLDRPDRKSRIRLTVRAPSDLRVVSNAAERLTATRDGRSEWTFEPTPSMATYLFFLAIGHFDLLEDASHRVRFRVFAPPGQGSAGAFALAAVPRVLAAFEEYYGIPYPLPKLDFVCVAEASFGAMENWGAIAFRDTRLLVDDASSSFARQDVLEVISHEVAHMWFGNLVTMASWTDIWLNESLASFLETKISERVEPTFDSRTDFFLRVAGTGAALEGDSLDATHPVRAPVASPDEIAQIFDEISYGKGSTLLAMLEGYLGEEAFRRGVTDYLERFRYANARTADLWESLTLATGEPVAALMDPWLDRPGLPLVTARFGEHGLELEQHRFSYHGRSASLPWPIPMSIDVDGRRERVRFDRPTLVVPVPSGATVHLNPGAVGFYRVAYDRPLLERLLRALPDRPAADRWTFLEDLFALFAAGEVDWPTYRRAVRALGTTSDRLVVDVISGPLQALSTWFPESRPVQELARWFFAEQFVRVGPARRPNEPAADGIVREEVAFARARIDAGFARELAEEFVGWSRVDRDLRLAVAVSRARTAGAAGYRELRRALEREIPEDEREQLEQALGWTGEPALLRETLERVASGEVNRGIVHLVLRNVAANPIGPPILWPWYREELGRVDELLRGSGLLSRALENTLPTIGIRLDRGAEMREFFRPDPFPEASRGVAKGLERLGILERMAPTVRALAD